MYIADLPRDLGVIKPFSGTATRPEDLGTSDITGDAEGNSWLLNTVDSSLNAWPRTPSIDGDTFEGLLPMKAFARSAGEAISSSRTYSHYSHKNVKTGLSKPLLPLD